jgi:hypothetical protein
MTLRSALLSFRIQRFETTIVVGATLLSVVVSALAIGLFTTGGYAECFSPQGPVLTSHCQSPIATALSRIIRVSISIVPLFPVIAGVIAGGPIVARELEAGTARLAWSLGPSRIRWFGQRALPILALVALAGLAIGLTAEALIHAMSPSIDLARSFAGFRGRGPLVGVEAVVVASIAIALGAILGRLVPTLILTLILVGGLIIAIEKVDRTTLLSEAVQTSGETFSWDDDMYLESRLKFPNGDVLTYEVAAATHPEIDEPWDEAPPYQDVVLSIPGERYPEIERREALLLSGLAVAFLAVGAVAVGRRRPR